MMIIIYIYKKQNILFLFFSTHKYLQKRCVNPIQSDLSDLSDFIVFFLNTFSFSTKKLKFPFSPMAEFMLHKFPF